MRFVSLLFCAITLFATNVSGATRTWTGAASNLWSNPGNWAEASAPVTGDALVFPAGAANLTNQNDLAGETKFASISFDDDYVLSGNPFGIREGLTVTAQADVQVSNRINVLRGQTWTTRAPLTRIHGTAWMIFEGEAGDTYTLTLDNTGELRAGVAAGNTVVLTGGGVHKVEARNVGYWESSITSHDYVINDGRHEFVEAGGRAIGHDFVLNGDACAAPPCDDALTFRTSPTINNLKTLVATGGLVEASTAADPATSTFASDEITFGPGVVYQVAVSPFIVPSVSMDFGNAPLVAGLPVGYHGGGSNTVTLNGAKLSVISVAPFAGCMQRTLIGNDGTDAIVGTFDGLPEGSTFTTASGQQFRISYVGGTGNDVTITAIDAGAEVCGATHADLNGDGRGDIVWRHAGTGENYLWRSNGLSAPYMFPINQVEDTNWQIAGLGDFDGDGKSDILWRHAITGENYLYLMNGATIVGAGPISVVDPDYWELGAIGDFDGDRKSDLVWRTKDTGENYLYLMDGFTIREAWYIESVPDTNWKIAAAGDLNNDGRDDLVWHHTLTGGVYGWLMDGFTTVGRGAINDVPDLDWKIVAVRDFDTDGNADIFWRHETSGDTYLYRMDGTTIIESGAPGIVEDLDWKPVAVTDYNYDGRADVLWRHASTGENYLWLMDGMTIRDRGFLPLLEDLDWTAIP